jgi:hypothetical protein
VPPLKPAVGVITGLPQEKTVVEGIPVGTKLKAVPLQTAGSVALAITGIGFTFTTTSNGFP